VFFLSRSAQHLSIFSPSGLVSDSCPRRSPPPPSSPFSSFPPTPFPACRSIPTHLLCCGLLTCSFLEWSLARFLSPHRARTSPDNAGQVSGFPSSFPFSALTSSFVLGTYVKVSLPYAVVLRMRRAIVQVMPPFSRRLCFFGWSRDRLSQSERPLVLLSPSLFSPPTPVQAILPSPSRFPAFKDLLSCTFAFRLLLSCKFMWKISLPPPSIPFLSPSI